MSMLVEVSTARSCRPLRRSVWLKRTRRREDVESHSQANGIWVSLTLQFPCAHAKIMAAASGNLICPVTLFLSCYNFRCFTILTFFEDRIAQTAVEAEEEEDDE
jgi:hypothetical protein